jgi:hypothetical protein
VPERCTSVIVFPSVGSPSTYAASRCPACRRSSSSVTLYRSNTLRVRWPVRSIAIRSADVTQTSMIP